MTAVLYLGLRQDRTLELCSDVAFQPPVAVLRKTKRSEARSSTPCRQPAKQKSIFRPFHSKGVQNGSNRRLPKAWRISFSGAIDDHPIGEKNAANSSSCKLSASLTTCGIARVEHDAPVRHSSRVTGLPVAAHRRLLHTVAFFNSMLEAQVTAVTLATRSEAGLPLEPKPRIYPPPIQRGCVQD